MTTPVSVRKKAFFNFITLADLDGAALCSVGHEREFATSHHPETGETTLQALVLAGIGGPYPAAPTQDVQEARFLKMTVWLLDHGADPHQLHSETGEAKEHKFQYNDGEKLLCRSDHQSASSLISDVLLKIEMMQKKKTDWEHVQKRLTRFVQAFQKATVATGYMEDQAQVATFVQDLWVKAQADTAAHDLVLVGTDGKTSAHSCMLAHASPVVAAMMQSGMAEATTRSISVDCPTAAVNYLLELIFTGSTSRAYSTDVGLPALDLAHRWQVDGAVRILERAACRALTKETFAPIAEAAVLKGLEVLRSECARFISGQEGKNLKNSKKLPAAVSKWLSSLELGPSAKKRRFSV
mmetsp:Transcript_67075/g.125323  ORF Transcript_67075/g.125323 Transcript_67075/m.125323 type:complete len:353 (-) Transcript_67075:98-1156(-)